VTDDIEEAPLLKYPLNEDLKLWKGVGRKLLSFNERRPTPSELRVSNFDFRISLFQPPFSIFQTPVAILARQCCKVLFCDA
jgi:hypothetical protein